VRKGYIPASYSAVAKKAMMASSKNLLIDASGQTNLKGTVSVSGLGGKPYRDGSFDYYMRNPLW
jgi:unsaturated rhamnogalacturonyl hydrolase